MSENTAPPGPPEPPQWSPPAGWSADQPAPWPQNPPPPGPTQNPPPPGYGQAPPPPGYGQAPPPPGYGQAPPPPGYGQAPPPGYGQAPPPTWGAPGQQWGPPPGQWGPPAWAPPPPAPKPGIVALRPLGVGELLDGALGLIRSNPRTVLGLAATISAVSALLQTLGLWLSLRLLDSTATTITGGTTTTVDVEGEITGILAGSIAQLGPALVAGFLQVLASGLFIVLVGGAVLGRRLDAGATWASLRPRFLPLVGLTVLLGLASLVGIALLVGVIVGLVIAFGPWAALPGLLIAALGGLALVYLYVKLALASPALVMEGCGVLESLRRSWALVRGSWWRVLGILILSAIITSLLTAVVTVPITAVSSILTEFSESLVPVVVASGIATLVSGIVVLPFSAAVTGLLYIDLRMRREALDIALVSAGVDPDGDPMAPYQPTH